MRVRAAFALLVVIAAALGCGPRNGIPGREILAAPDKVEVFRVKPDPAETPEGKAIRSYPILATGKEQSADFAARLDKILFSSGVTQNKKKCGLSPGIAYRITKGKRVMEVLICFNCDVLWAYVIGEPVNTENPQYEWKDFDPVRAQLVELAKEAFPDDPEIQSLTDARK